ncbi:hypothetical protein PENCOP_c007G04775 [Penicillium coprophilum]|uniref:Uncharacterized protein n=1 Tax=Penicillium coprophilum TaxID=36646 RepID=A0A1V6ULP9_9EURO|nr:hypothetical protein PENCOP_c007G04775 [Penicillium coprophilum]
MPYFSTATALWWGPSS